MELQTLIPVVLLGITVLGGIFGIIVAVVRGDMKKFIEQKMVEAEESGKSGGEKLAYVINAVKDKYKVMELFLNVKKFIEHVIELSKRINSK